MDSRGRLLPINYYTVTLIEDLDRSHESAFGVLTKTNRGERGKGVENVSHEGNSKADAVKAAHAIVRRKFKEGYRACSANGLGKPQADTETAKLFKELEHAEWEARQKERRAKQKAEEDERRAQAAAERAQAQRLERFRQQSTVGLSITAAGQFTMAL